MSIFSVLKNAPRVLGKALFGEEGEEVVMFCGEGEEGVRVEDHGSLFPGIWRRRED